MNVPLMHYEGSGRAPQRMGLAHPSICPYGAFTTKDGHSVLIAIQNEREWVEFCAKFMQQPDLPTRAGFRSNNERVINRAAVDGLIADVFGCLTRDEAAERLRRASTAYGFVNDIAALSAHPALRRIEVQTHQGAALIIAPPVKSHPAGHAGAQMVPAVGEHSDAIRQEFSRKQGR
jgi:itaconate CoA-transferase